MLLYLYKCDDPNSTGEDNPLVLHAGMYALGDKHDIKHLEYLAMEYFSESLKGHTFNDDFFNAVAIVYSTTLPSNRGLHDYIAPTMKKYWSKLRGKENFIGVLKSNCDIAIDLIDHYTASTDKVVNKKPQAATPWYQQWVVCPICNDMQMTDLSCFGDIYCSVCHTSRNRLKKHASVRTVGPSLSVMLSNARAVV